MGDFIASTPYYFLLMMALLPAFVVFFVMLFFVIRARADKRVAELRLQDAQQNVQELQLQNQVLDDEIKALGQEKDYLDQRLVATTTELNLLQQSIEQEFAKNLQLRETLSKEFELLSNRIIQEKGQVIVQQNRQAIDHLLAPFKDRLENFQKRVNDIHTQSVQGNAVLGTQIRSMVEMGMKISDEAQALTRALKGDKKALGNWGELQLEQALQQAGLVKDKNYKTQVSFKTTDGQLFMPDVVVYLPDQKHLIVDSKVSLTDYQQALKTSDPVQQAQYLARHVKAVRHHIDELSNKNYSDLPGLNSPAMVFMFMPIEAAFIEVLKHQETLFQYAYSKNIVMVSPTTLVPLLKTIAFLWMLENSNQQALELGNKALDIYNQAARVAEHLQKLGQTLNTAANQYNLTVRAFAGGQGLTQKIDRFNSLSAKAGKTISATPEIDAGFDEARLK